MEAALQVHLGYVSPSEMMVTWVTGSYQLGVGPALPPQPLVASTARWRPVAPPPAHRAPTWVSERAALKESGLVL